MSDSATPRTDAVCVLCDGGWGWTHMVDADFARQLERELNAALSRVRELEKLNMDYANALLNAAPQVAQESGLTDGSSGHQAIGPAGAAPPGLVERLRERARIRRQIPTRKSVQNGEPDRIADLLDEAADALLASQGGDGGKG